MRCMQACGGMRLRGHSKDGIPQSHRCRGATARFSPSSLPLTWNTDLIISNSCRVQLLAHPSCISQPRLTACSAAGRDAPGPQGSGCPRRAGEKAVTSESEGRTLGVNILRYCYSSLRLVSYSEWHDAVPMYLNDHANQKIKSVAS